MYIQVKVKDDELLNKNKIWKNDLLITNKTSAHNPAL